MYSPSEHDSKCVLNSGVCRNMALRATQDVSGCAYMLVLGLFGIIFWSPFPPFILSVYTLERGCWLPSGDVHKQGRAGVTAE